MRLLPASFLFILILIPFDVIFPVFGYLADVVELCVILVVLSRLVMTAKISRHWVYVFGFVFFSVILSLVFGISRPLSNIFAQSVIDIKFFVFFFMFSYLIESKRISIDEVESIFVMLLGLTFIGAVVNVLWGEGYYSFFNIKVDFRANDLLPRVSGLQFNPNNFGMTIVMCLIAMPRFYGHLSIRNLSVIAVSIALVFMSGSRVALAVLLLAFVIYFLFGHGKGVAGVFVRSFVVFVLMLPLVVIAYDSWFILATIDNFKNISSVNDTTYIRGIMLFEGIGSAITNFPFGWGLATFGSVLSEGSPVYDQLGLAGSIFVIEGRGIYDSSIASILGELGFCGLIYYIAMSRFILFLRTAKSSHASSHIHLLTLALSLFVYALTSPVFFSDYMSFLMAMVFAYVCHSTRSVDVRFS